MYEAAFASIVVVRLPFFFSLFCHRVDFRAIARLDGLLSVLTISLVFFEETYEVVHRSLKLLYFYSLVLVHNRRNCLQL